MPVIHTEEQVVEDKQFTWFECDVNGCEVRSDCQADLNYVTINPHMKSLSESSHFSDEVDWSEVIILCENHLEGFEEMVTSSMGVEFETIDNMGLRQFVDG